MKKENKTIDEQNMKVVGKRTINKSLKTLKAFIEQAKEQTTELKKSHHHKR